MADTFDSGIARYSRICAQTSFRRFVNDKKGSLGLKASEPFAFWGGF